MAFVNRLSFMKIRLHLYLLSSLLVAFAMTENTFAQDAGMSDVEINEERNRTENEKIIFSAGDSEVRYIPKTTSILLKDSVAAGNQGEFLSGKPEKKQPKQEDDSILSFNFLYYIIQKYKLQDIID